MKNKYKEDKRIIDTIVGDNRNEIKKDGYYLIYVCDKYDGYNEKVYVTSNESCEKVKDFEIFGKFEDGIMTELITGTLLKYIDDVDIIIEKKKIPDEKFKDNYTNNYYFSSPGYLKAIQLYPKDVAIILNDLDNDYNVSEYKKKILSQINNATSKYEELVKDDEETIDNFIHKHRTKNKMRI